MTSCRKIPRMTGPFPFLNSEKQRAMSAEHLECSLEFRAKARGTRVVRVQMAVSCALLWEHSLQWWRRMRARYDMMRRTPWVLPARTGTCKNPFKISARGDLVRGRIIDRRGFASSAIGDKSQRLGGVRGSAQHKALVYAKYVVRR